MVKIVLQFNDKAFGRFLNDWDSDSNNDADGFVTFRGLSTRPGHHYGKKRFPRQTAKQRQEHLIREALAGDNDMIDYTKLVSFEIVK